MSRTLRDLILGKSQVLPNVLSEFRPDGPRDDIMVRPVGADSHLGGYVNNSKFGDAATFYPNMWAWAVKLFRIRSVIDIGCGEGYSVEYFQRLGCNVLGIEGHAPAVVKANSRVPGKIVRHDYSVGPYTPKCRFDMAWCCEFVEHVDEQYAPNFSLSDSAHDDAQSPPGAQGCLNN